MSQPSAESSTSSLAALPYRQVSRSWLVLWALTYIIIIALGLLTPQNPLLTAVRVSGILLCSFYIVRTFPKDHLLQAAMITTFIADCFLVQNNTSSLGLLIFYFAQSIHLYRLQTPERRQSIITVTAGATFLIIVNHFLQLVPTIFLICGFYALTLVCNFYTSAHWYKTNPKNPASACAFAGFALFACCDLCTVVSFMSLTGVFLSWLYAPANFLAWFFYYPSQILVSNSTKCATIGLKEGKC